MSGDGMDYGEMAGVPGFEPGNVGTKNRCLTTWRHPNVARFLHGLTVLRNTPETPAKTLCETLERQTKRGYNPPHCDGQRGRKAALSNPVSPS